MMESVGHTAAHRPQSTQKPLPMVTLKPPACSVDLGMRTALPGQMSTHAWHVDSELVQRRHSDSS